MSKFDRLEIYFRKMVPHLSHDTWRTFVNSLVVRNYVKGEIISEENKVNNIVNFIDKGAVMVYNHINGRRNIYNFFFEQEFTGDYESFLTRRPAKYGLEALEDTVTFNLHYDKLQKIYTDYPDFERVGRIVAESQFLRLTERNASLLAEKPEIRYANLIKAKPQVVQRVPQYHIASYLGVTPEALSRIRKRIISKDKT